MRSIDVRSEKTPIVRVRAAGHGREAATTASSLLGDGADRGRAYRPAAHRQQRPAHLANRHPEHKARQDHPVDVLRTTGISPQHSIWCKPANARDKQSRSRRARLTDAADRSCCGGRRGQAWPCDRDAHRSLDPSGGAGSRRSRRGRKHGNHRPTPTLAPTCPSPDRKPSVICGSSQILALGVLL
jgi:hypothetical protein